MKTIKQVLLGKNPNIWSISPEASVFQALEMLADKDIGALIVLENNEIVGILSERDYARKVILSGKSSRTTLVRDIMTADVIGISPESSIEECMALMSQNHIRHLPVYDGSRVVGVVSIGDIVKAIIDEQELLIDNLVYYITGH